MLQTNNQPIDILYNDVKNLTSILSFCIGPKCVSSKYDTKALFLCELHFSLFCNEMKILSSILCCCNGVNIVPSTKDWKALRHWDNISLIFITPHERTNQGLIYHLYTDMMNLPSIFNIFNGCYFWQ